MSLPLAFLQNFGMTEILILGGLAWAVKGLEKFVAFLEARKPPSAEAK